MPAASAPAISASLDATAAPGEPVPWAEPWLDPGDVADPSVARGAAVGVDVWQPEASSTTRMSRLLRRRRSRTIDPFRATQGRDAI